ncbi:MAG: carbohydrate-binding domain-containing protein [Oscillospiraceae bacterium]|nr:carbohydrate-binding domain-containing protein [Oscillospiraceae bacterium]
MKKQILPLLLTFALLLTACGKEPAGTDGTTGTDETAAAASGTVSGNIDTGDLFTDRDLSGTYDEDDSVVISFDGSSVTAASDEVKIDGTTVTISGEGVYILSGTLDDGMIIVNADKSDKIQLVLDGAAIHSETSAPIYVLQADKVFLTLAEGTENSLSNGGTFTAIDENSIDSVVYSKEDLTLNGSGSLTITSPAGHGIVSKDELTATGGTYTIHCASHGLAGKDNVSISGGTFTIAAGKDGIHGENNDDTSLGFVYIQDGTFDITAEGDGVSAGANLQIDGGTFQILAGGGSVNGNKTSSDNWGGSGGMGGPGGMGGGRPGGRSSDTTTDTTTDSSDDSTSMKGMKAGADLLITGGSFTIDSADDAVHSNTNATVCGGTFEIATGDDAFHAEETLTISEGSIHITESYEGLEGLHVIVSGGDIKLVATDDGINAAGGTDLSGLGGRDQMFGGGMGRGGSSNGTILISGGNLYINSSGDGLDANGTLEISGGFTTVVGPTQGDTATLDYDTSAVISGGTFIGTGASGMAQTFSDSQQGVIAVSVGSQSAGTQITLTDSDGNTIVSYAPELPFGVVILSSPDMVKGDTYKITVGSASAEFEAD